MKIDKPPKLGDAWPTSDNVLGIGISGSCLRQPSYIACLHPIARSIYVLASYLVHNYEHIYIYYVMI